MKKDTEMTTRERELYDLCVQIIEIGEKIVARGGGDIRFERKITGIDDTPPKEEGRIVYVGSDMYWEYTDWRGRRRHKRYAEGVRA